jgi:hypothetical protein
MDCLHESAVATCSLGRQPIKDYHTYSYWHSRNGQNTHSNESYFLSKYL